MFILAFVFFCSSVFADNLGPAPVDPEYENLIYGIYDKHHKQPTSASEWSELLYEKKVDTYSLKKGENLWDVSRNLFGKPDYWSKLWAVNSNLSNPHKISEGYVLNITQTHSKQRATPPTKPRVTKTDEINSNQSEIIEKSDILPREYVRKNTSEPISKCVTELSQISQHPGMTRVYDQEFKCYSYRRRIISRRTTDRSKVDEFRRNNKSSTIAQVTPARKVGAAIPKSFPHINLINKKTFVFKGDTSPPVENTNIVTNYQIDEEDIDIVGRVSEIIGGIPVPSGEVILKLDVPAQVGDSFSVIHPIQPIRSQVRVPFILEGRMGEEVLMQARVTITGVSRKGLYFAQIDSMYNPFNTRSHVIREDVSTFNLNGRFRKGNARSQIVATASGQSGSMLMVHSFVYLNKGSEKGINLGDVFDIQSNKRLHGRHIKQSLGEVLVVHITPSYSTAFVMNLRNPAFVGDYVTSFENIDLFDQDEEDVMSGETSEFIEDDEEDVISEETSDFIDDDEEDVISEETSDFIDDDEEVMEERPEVTDSMKDDFEEDVISEETSDFIEEDVMEELPEVTDSMKDDDEPEEEEDLLQLSTAEDVEISNDDMIDEYDSEEQEWLIE